MEPQTLSERKQFLIKVFALLSLVRWYNILFTAFSQYLAALFVFNSGKSKWDVLLHLDIHLIVVSTAFIIAGGYIINAFYDFEKDLINRPSQTVFDRLISKEFALRCYFLFTGIGLSIAAFTTLNVFLYFSGFVVLLWFYSHKLQKITFLREVAASILSVLSVLSVALYFHHVADLKLLLIYSAVIMTLLFIRELVKDIVGMTGDEAFGYQTVTVRFGLDATRVFVHLVTAFGLILMGVLISLTQYLELWIFLALQLILLVSMNALLRSGKRKKWRLAYTLSRLTILLAILFIVFF